MALSRYVLLLLAFAFSAWSQNFYLKNGDRVVFYGDSITDQRLYTLFTEEYTITRFPAMNVTFVHSGWGGDRVTGGGGGPVDLRLQRDVIAYKPTVMTIMLGMNDASYRAFDPNIFDTFAKGYEHIVQTVKTALPGIRITAIDPSPFDDVTRPPQFEGGYNGVLARYGEFVKELASREKLTVADLNAPVVADLKKANELDPALAGKLLPDRVHPGPAGHLLMAKALLTAWQAPAAVTSVELDAAGYKVVRSDNTEAKMVERRDGLTWNQTDKALPFPLDLKDPGIQLALKASGFADALDREMLKVIGLPADRYTLKIDGSDVGTFTKDQLASGINLATLPTPMLKQAMDVHTLTKRHNDIHFSRWRTVQVPMQDEKLASKDQVIASLDKLEADVVDAQRAMAKPRPHRYELAAAGTASR